LVTRRTILGAVPTTAVSHRIRQHRCAMDADIKGYFDNIPHPELMEQVSKKISESRGSRYA